MIQLEFDERRHKYSIGGRWVPSVTAIEPPKPALMHWAANMAAEYVKENVVPGYPLDEIGVKELVEGTRLAYRKKGQKAADVGTLTHEACERFAKGEKDVVVHHPQAANAFAAFKDWCIEHAVIFVAAERKVYHWDHDYCGTLDLLAKVNGELAVIDIKTSKAIYTDYRLQIAAYAAAIEREDQCELPVNWILRLDKDGDGFEAHSFEKDRDMPGFLGLLDYHRWNWGTKG